MADMKKILGVAKNVLVWLLTAAAVFMMIFTLFSVNTFDRNDKSLFGYKFFIVQTDSMSKTDFDAGDIIIVKEVDIRDLQVGDIITFISESSENFGKTITHKIREVTKDEDGSIAFVTYGTTTDENDEALAKAVIGQYQTNIPKMGHFFAFLKTTPGYIVCILVPFLCLILFQGVNCVRLFRQYKQEQQAVIEAEKAQIAEERAESQRMMQELLALKAQLAQQGSQVDTTESPMDSSVEQMDETVQSVEETETVEAETEQLPEME